MAISTLDIAWAAGFLEGEGSFTVTYRGRESGAPRVTVSQVQAEPLYRLQALFGGGVHIVHRSNPNPNHSDIWHYQAASSKAVQIMLTVYVFMSSKRREQIERCVREWRSVITRKKRERMAPFCSNGHAMTEENTYTYWVAGGKDDSKMYQARSCRTCRRLKMRVRRSKDHSMYNVPGMFDDL